MNGSQLVLLSDFCLNRVDVRSVETVQRKLLVLRSRRPRLETLEFRKESKAEKRKPVDWSASRGATGPDRFPSYSHLLLPPATIASNQFQICVEGHDCG